jgi:phosphatidylinositol alpha-1,6-mannosyltransferase
VTGRVVADPRDPDGVADVVTGLLDDPPGARAMGAAGRAWVEQRWSWTTIAQTLAEVLDG